MLSILFRQTQKKVTILRGNHELISYLVEIQMEKAKPGLPMRLEELSEAYVPDELVKSPCLFGLILQKIVHWLATMEGDGYDFIYQCGLCKIMSFFLASDGNRLK